MDITIVQNAQILIQQILTKLTNNQKDSTTININIFLVGNLNSDVQSLTDASLNINHALQTEKQKAPKKIAEGDILMALKDTDWNQGQAATILNIDQGRLSRLCKLHGILPPSGVWKRGGLSLRGAE